MGTHDVPVTVSSGLSQYGLMLSFNALEQVSDNNETDTNSTNVDDLDDLDDDQEQDTDSEEDTQTKPKIRASQMECLLLQLLELPLSFFWLQF